jgi:hypothetical protein
VIADNNPLITAAAVAAIVVATSVLAPNRQPTAPGRLSGVLYSIDADSQAARVAAASMPELDIGLDPAARALLPPSSALIVRFVGIDESTFTLTLARRLQETPGLADEASKAAAAAAASAAKAAKKKAKRPAKKPSVVVAAVPAPSLASAAAPVLTSTAAAPATPKPTFPPTFAEIDGALRASSTVQTINVRLKKGGVTFRLTQVGRVDDRYVIRYAIANEDTDTFFLSIVNVSADGAPIHSETAGPYSCPTGQEVYGVVHFLPSAVVGKSVVVELVQSGGDHRRFSLTADYPF